MGFARAIDHLDGDEFSITDFVYAVDASSNAARSRGVLGSMFGRIRRNADRIHTQPPSANSIEIVVNLHSSTRALTARPAS